ncbi:hypothetical protein C2857_004762 [Epichloe festucae Fl1]|uniref:Dihydroneopterin aldolase/epimerase domain-containing protein n=1 Tax=Epichloe festucae (strain Fl1) TaxID=877507 RepID=A0A7S9KSU0_EPIFF|nr:hypothetical protein C2857_004762 [Epichloe festucae Fl1]
MPTTLQTSHSLLVATGQSPSIVRVKNIQSIVRGPSDAWGRPNRPQPVSVSVTVHLDKAFGSTSTSDALTSDTIHYGLLSKAVLATLTRLDAHKTSRQALPLPDILEAIWVDLTGLDICGQPIDVDVDDGTPFLQLAFLKSLQVTVHLPKASLQGGGVSLTGTGVFKKSVLIGRGVALKLHDMRVPVLIGVNDNEREAKQGVVANVEVERFDEAGDSYCDLEKVVVKAMADSSFETIEALVADMAVHMTAHLAKNHKAPPDDQGWHLNIAVEKPIAVVFADAPCVELRIGTNDVRLNKG